MRERSPGRKDAICLDAAIVDAIGLDDVKGVIASVGLAVVYLDDMAPDEAAA